MTQDPRNKGGFGGGSNKQQPGQGQKYDPTKSKNPYGQDKTGQDKSREKEEHGGGGKGGSY